MIRDLLWTWLPAEHHALTILIGAGEAPTNLEYLLNISVPVGFLMGLIIAGAFVVPQSSPVRNMTPVALIGATEMTDWAGMSYLIAVAVTLHMSLTTNYVLATMSFYHLGGMVGCVFYGALAKWNRKMSLLLSQLFGVAILIVLMIFSAAIILRSLTVTDRDFQANGHLGNRKIRGLLDPALGKALTNEIGYAGVFPLDYQRFTLIFVFAGFAFSCNPVAHQAVMDLCPSDLNAFFASLLYGLLYWWLAAFTGIMITSWIYILADLDGAFLLFAVFRALRMIYLLVAFTDTRQHDRGWESEETFCFVKALYYCTYLWPQGGGQEILQNMVVYMIYDRFHWESASAGWLCGLRQRVGRAGNFYLWGCLKYLHMPVIGIMFWSMFMVNVNNPQLWVSTTFEMGGVFNQMGNMESYWVWISIYPAFVNSWAKLADAALILGVCDAMRHLGDFMAISRWPNQLLCGDPMACWRSQYLYSHAVFQATGGDAGNISWVNWYLFSKSQRRQCCCPYRKLKADAPSRCCPPCCLGPLVEETGGCPCPCCCASCSS